MRKNNFVLIFLSVGLGFVYTIINGCKEDEITKKNPIITWTNPADIVFGTLLDSIQLNASANVHGIFTYTPPFGSRLNIGTSQDLRVDFTPLNKKYYNSIGKIVNINVIDDTITDIDGNEYKIVTIGTQTWMAENLKTTKYNDGSDISFVPVDTSWNKCFHGGYCWYDNNIDNKNIYGALYNWYAVATEKLAPKGWRIPDENEWVTLINYLGGDSLAGNKLKEVGTTHWNNPNFGVTNESGFTALPGGYRIYNGYFGVGRTGYWWSRSNKFVSGFGQPSGHYGVCFSLDSDQRDVNSCYNDYRAGYSVRCIRY